MIHTFISSLRAQTSNDQDSSRRRAPRRDADRCVAVINGHTFPVENWSSGGVLIIGEDRLFATDQNVNMVLKFGLRNTILNVDLQGQVLRKSTHKIAIKFGPVTQTIQRYFRQVLDDAIAQEFANSQAMTQSS